VGDAADVLPRRPDLREETLRVKNRLKVLRAERDWSQADLADRLAVSRQTVNSIETGKYDPSLPLALKIGKLFGQPLETIFLDDPGTNGQEA
jgi:putative transcriptional regulator